MRESPALEQAYRRFKAQGLAVVGIFVQDTEANAKRFVKEFGLTFPVGFDPDLGIANLFRFVGMPLTVFVTKDGTIAKRVVGPLAEAILLKEIQKLLAQGSSGEGGDPMELSMPAQLLGEHPGGRSPLAPYGVLLRLTGARADPEGREVRSHGPSR